MLFILVNFLTYLNIQTFSAKRLIKLFKIITQLKQPILKIYVFGRFCSFTMFAKRKKICIYKYFFLVIISSISKLLKRLIESPLTMTIMLHRCQRTHPQLIDNSYGLRGTERYFRFPFISMFTSITFLSVNYSKGRMISIYIKC